MSEEAVEISVPGLSFAEALNGGSRPLLDPENPVVFIDVSVGSHSMGRIKMELFKNIMPKCAENFRQFCTGEFRQNQIPVGYKDCFFHRVLKGFMVHGGDFVKLDGSGSLSIYGPSFPREAPKDAPTIPPSSTSAEASQVAAAALAMGSVPHFRAGLLCMANGASAGAKAASSSSSSSSSAVGASVGENEAADSAVDGSADSNGCQFFITCGPCLWLDGRNDVFGQILGRDSFQVLRKIEHVSTDAQGKPRVQIQITQCGEL